MAHGMIGKENSKLIDPKKKQRVDFEFEELIIRCAVGCIINDIPLTDNDFVRMELAFSRLLSKYR